MVLLEILDTFFYLSVISMVSDGFCFFSVSNWELSWRFRFLISAMCKFKLRDKGLGRVVVRVD